MASRLYVEGFLEDITARKETEQLKADFVSFVTHQLRTPLSGIRWMLELARDAVPPGEVASYVDDAHESAQRLIGLVNDLLDIARLESGKLTTVPSALDLQALSASIVAELAPLAELKKQRVDVSGETVPLVYADPQLTRQAVLNLVSNAIKYTPAGGDASPSRPGRMAITCAVRCSDTGIGISAASQRRLFEKFYRADNAQMIDTEGTGLGLYLVRLIAERSGGSVSCQSVERSGSTFTLDAAGRGRRESHRMSAHTILLAEDDRFLRRAMEVALTKRGFTVLLAADGQEALDLLGTHTPDLLLLDLLMPRMTGLEVLQALRRETRTAALRVLILSNSSKELEMHGRATWASTATGSRPTCRCRNWAIASRRCSRAPRTLLEQAPRSHPHGRLIRAAALRRPLSQHLLDSLPHPCNQLDRDRRRPCPRSRSARRCAP